MRSAPERYFQLWTALESVAGARELPLLFARHLRSESFDTAILAATCSRDFNTAVTRLRQYKPLIGPLRLQIDKNAAFTAVTIDAAGLEQALPAGLELAELVFFCQLIRIATRRPVTPLKLTMRGQPRQHAAYADYFGIEVGRGTHTRIRFAAADAAYPFLTADQGIWSFLKGSLNRRLADLQRGASAADRVRSVLVAMLPGGEVGIDAVAERLAVSRRTLQRQLEQESQSFQALLATVRKEMANQYLQRSQLSLGEISFLLGFVEQNSFIRAYRGWTGMTPGQYRARTN